MEEKIEADFKPTNLSNVVGRQENLIICINDLLVESIEVLKNISGEDFCRAPEELLKPDIGLINIMTTKLSTTDYMLSELTDVLSRINKKIS